ncbi:MAG: hypothetical protein V4582_18115 [Pseudomonadota bacterium]
MVNDEISLELASHLSSEKPAVLFLGQTFSVSEATGDRILSQFLERLGRQHGNASWAEVLAGPGITDADLAWLSERFDRSVFSDSTYNMLEVGWSAVFTTSIDPKLVRALESRNRAPEAILARDHFARVPRSRSRPGIHFLFGKANETESQYRPPRTVAEKKKRIAVHANQFINRISDTVTPLGLLVIDGLIPEMDWLPIDDLLAPISGEQSLKIFWFGLKDVPESDFFADLVNSGVIRLDPRPLSEVISLLQAQNAGVPLGHATQSDTGTISLKNDEFFRVPPSLRLRVEAAAAIVDDTWTDQPADIFGAEEAEAFQRFHGDLVGIRGMVEGIARGFAVKRSFEDLLHGTVEKLLKGPTGADYVIVHGQSGVGKSVAMARLAFIMRTAHKVPVLFCWGRVPTPHELDEFCAEGERAGAAGTVVLCDANQPIERYRELATGMRSRGRRVTVVGTCYKVDSIAKDKRFVEAPTEINPSERAELTKLLEKFGGQTADAIRRTLSDDNVLALLYRHLSSSRNRISGGIAGEARAAEHIIRLRAQSVPNQKDAKYILAEKLIEAGIRNSNSPVFEDDGNTAETGADPAGRLIDLVMVVGRLDCAVPVNLVIRALKALTAGLDIAQISYLFGELDLFRWRMADAEGNDLLVQPRLQLEAELICKRRLASVDREIECIAQLIGAVRSTAVDRSAELDFLLDLLSKLHRDGPRSKAYETGYLSIAHTLTRLRSMHRVEDSRLILQESAFRRAAVHVMDRAEAPQFSDSANDGKRAEILNDAREIIEIALDAIAQKKLHASRKTHHHLLNERASIYGYLTVGLARSNASEQDIWPNYLAARAAILKAMAMEGDYHSQDVGVWTPHDILRVPNLQLSPSHQAELKADILSVIDDVDVDALSPVSNLRFQTRKVKVAETLDQIELGEEALAQLEATAPNVAAFLKARSMCPEIFEKTDKAFDLKTRERAAIAAKYLEDRFEKIVGDIRPIQLLLQLRWAAQTGHRLVRLERFPIPQDQSFLSDILSIVSDLNGTAGDDARNVFRFLEATLEWVKGDTHRARELFRELGSDTEFEDPSRIVRRLILESPSDPHNGFRGRIEKKRSPGHWTISIPGFPGTVDLLERDFSHESIQIGREIPRFNIAFNYLGPIADPILRHSGNV